MRHPASLLNTDSNGAVLRFQQFSVKHRTLARLSATLLSFSLLSAQPRPPDDPLLRWMDRIAQQMLQRRDYAIAEVRTVAGAERRKQAVREKTLTMMGGLPDYKGP